MTKEPEVPVVVTGWVVPGIQPLNLPMGPMPDPDAIGQAIFMHCDMDEHMAEWDKMGGRDRHPEYDLVLS
ncbi:hypothetical protein P4S72_29700 [Vibrio sp. PP-XX7]